MTIFPRNPRIMVTGVTGVGKTHILGRLRDDPDYEVFEFGKSMKQLLQELPENSRPDIAALPLSTRQSLQARIARDVDVKADKTPVVIDGHLLVEQAGTGLSVPGISSEDYKRLDLDGIILILDSPSNIAARRSRNTSRYRDYNSDPQVIDAFQDDLRIACMSFSILYGSFFSRIDLRNYESLESGDPSWQQPQDDLKSLVDILIENLQDQ